MNKNLMDVVRIMATWFSSEKQGRDMNEHDDEIMRTIVASAVYGKLEMADMKIIIPDALIVLFITLTDNNPGQSLMLFRDILDSIVERSGHKIRPGYVIKPSDVGMAFPQKWPFMTDPEINEKYHQKWLAQKKPFEAGCSDNKCDTPEWWREVYAD